MVRQSKKNKILLLNPPSSRKILRDYYCSTFSKASYYWQPIDLLAVGALLQNRAEVTIMDAVARGLSPKKIHQWIADHAPDAVFALVSALTRHTDLTFLQGLTAAGRRLVIGGEAALDWHFDFDRYPFVDGLLLDFTCGEAVSFLTGRPPAGRLRTAEYWPVAPRRQSTYTLGIMPHEHLEPDHYRLPLWRGRFYSLLTDFGCPFDCPFCNSGRSSLGFKLRDPGEIGQELGRLHQLGARQLYIRDMTFGADKNHADTVLRLLEPFSFRLRGYLRADQVTPAFARRLKKAGFEMVQIGVESPRQPLRHELRKPISDTALAEAFAVLQETGIQAGAHFLIGWRDKDVDSARACVQAARQLKAAYCSINIYRPRLGIDPMATGEPARHRLLSLAVEYQMKRYNGARYLRFLFRR